MSLTLAITGALVAVSFAMSRDALRNVINDQLTAISESTVNQVEHWLVSQQENLGLWASQPESLAALDPNPAGDQIRHAIEEQLARAAKAYGCFEFIQIADINGAAIVSSDPSAELRKINVADREYFKQAAAGRSVVSDVLASRKSGNPVVVLATPIKAGTEVRGVLFAVVDLNWFSKEVIARITVLNTGYACLFDHQGRVLAHPDRTKLLKTKLTDFEWGGPLLERHEGQFDYVIDGVHKHAAFKTSDRLGWGVMVTVPDSEVNAPFLRLGRISLLLSIVAVIAGAVLMFFVARSVSDPIQRIAGQLAVGADQTAGAAREVSEASQALAAGASEQAAAVEQSISSLEMLSSVTTHNADSAVQVSALAKQAREAADNGTSDMRAMNNAINEIKASSHQVEQIIKTIDEIAFQTNILALNAAVEAARAGDAGAGFAVVADEVRHLAQRASQAANDTTIKIQGAIAKTAQGVELDRKVAQAFEAIATRTRQVEELATAVATASREQARSISEVSLAVRQMETVVQRNAASAEEAAGASQEMDAQAEVVRDSVFQLFRVVGGDRSVSSGVPVPAPHTAASRSVLPEQSTAPAMPSPNEHALSAPRQPVSEMRRPTPLPPLRRD